MVDKINQMHRFPLPLLIEQLVQYGYTKQLLNEYDIPYVRNQLLELFKCEEPVSSSFEMDEAKDSDNIIEQLIDYGYELGLIEYNTLAYRDLLDAKIMGLLMARPSQFIAEFQALQQKHNVQAATNYFYHLSIDSRYIRMDRIKKNPTWMYEADYGHLQITINLSKPEKDPKEIAKLKTLPPAKYPKCLLCKENVGYAGRLDHPARQNLRVLPVELQQEQWYLQYSPYVYYNEHSIVLNGEHTDMRITDKTFARLLDFVDQFPHYFIGSNADLPIVGGSILNHDHYQAGRHSFPMEHAKVVRSFTSRQFAGVTLALLDWPLSVVRLSAASRAALLDAAVHILEAWRVYSDEEHHILAFTTTSIDEYTPHNTITPIARKRHDGDYELDLVLRNNRTNEQYPFGIFHPDESLHHIKKENIGLIEVMGLAVLPARLKGQLDDIVTLLTSNDHNRILDTADNSHPLFEHHKWIISMHERYGSTASEQHMTENIQIEVGKKFSEVLQCSGVFKQNGCGIDASTNFIVHTGFNDQN